MLCVNAAGSSHYARAHAATDELHRAGIGTVLVDLLTEEESTDDPIAERVQFDLPLLSGRINALRDWIAQQPDLSEYGLGYLGTDTGSFPADGFRVGHATDEVPSRGIWRHYRALMEQPS